jgi:hypothetical protein
MCVGNAKVPRNSFPKFDFFDSTPANDGSERNNTTIKRHADTSFFIVVIIITGIPMETKIIATAAVALPVCYVCSKRASSVVQHSLVACLWIVFLGIPFLEQEEPPIHTFSTMVASVLAFEMPLKLTQLVLYPPLPRDDDGTSTLKKSDDEPKEAPLSWKDFASFAGSFLFYAIPISRTKAPLPTWPVLLKQNAITLAVVLFKITIIPLFELALNQLADKYPYPSLESNPVAYLKMEILFTLELIAMAWGTDIQSVIINVLSGGRLEMLYMHNYPFLSSSLRDLWGRRYNLLINSLLKETVYIPAQTYYGYSKRVASLLAFLTSGLLHSWVAHFTFGTGVVRACLFFVSQALWMNLVEGQSWYRESVPPIAKAVLTVCYFYATALLYVGLFVESMPDWLDKNPQTVPDIPLLRHVTSFMAASLGLVQSE